MLGIEPGPLEEQPVLLTTELSLQHLEFYFFHSVAEQYFYKAKDMSCSDLINTLILLESESDKPSELTVSVLPFSTSFLGSSLYIFLALICV